MVYGEWDALSAQLDPLIMLFAWVFVGAYSGGSCRSLLLGLERTSPTLEPKSLLKGESPSIIPGIEGFGVVHGSKI